MNEFDDRLGIIIGVGGCVAGAYRAYVAWFQPDCHRKHLQQIATLYSGWNPEGQRWWESNFNFWVMRFAYTLGFLIFLVGLSIMLFG